MRKSGLGNAGAKVTVEQGLHTVFNTFLNAAISGVINGKTPNIEDLAADALGSELGYMAGNRINSALQPIYEQAKQNIEIEKAKQKSNAQDEGVWRKDKQQAQKPTSQHSTTKIYQQLKGKQQEAEGMFDVSLDFNNPEVMDYVRGVLSNLQEIPESPQNDFSTDNMPNEKPLESIFPEKILFGGFAALTPKILSAFGLMMLSTGFRKFEETVQEISLGGSGKLPEPIVGGSGTAKVAQNAKTPAVVEENAASVTPKKSMSGRIKNAGLTNTGKTRYIPRKGYNPQHELPKGPNDGYIDKFGNEWIKGPSRTIGEAYEWDVLLSPTGKNQFYDLLGNVDYMNVSLRGRITHGFK